MPSSSRCSVAFVACTIATVLGALIALALARYRILGGTVLNLLLILPLTTPEIVFGASLFTLFFNQGVSRGFWTIVIAHTMFCLSLRRPHGQGPDPRDSTGRSRTPPPTSARRRCGRSSRSRFR